MRWRQSRRSTNIEDRRGRRPGIAIGGGGAGLLLLVLAMMCMGGDPAQLLDIVGNTQITQPQSQPTQRPSDEVGDFLSAVLGSTEDVWSEVFAASGARYSPPTLVMFSDIVRSGCGTNSASTGPFYCPLDQKVYLDTSFFQQLAQLGGPGDFAAAYVIGHEIGHHVQNLVGTSNRVRQLQSRGDQADANALSVMLELQADCYAGAWAYHANRTAALLEPGDVEEGLAAAAAIGDDRLMQQSGRAVSPESFTHGTSAQRQRWLETGLRTGDLNACDTFNR